MKILLLGKTGQVGWELNRSLLTLGEVTALDYPQVNMADADSISAVVKGSNPNIIINATAYTNVDKAESEPGLAMAINGAAPGILAREAKKINAALIHYSTDFVFDGEKGEPYIETDQPNPINVYGKTKLTGEEAIQHEGGAFLILRTAWVYSLRRPCFVTKVLEWARTQEVLRIVDDQISSPTWARLLAEATAQIIVQAQNDPPAFLTEKSGLYHLAGNGQCSRYRWAEAILESNSNKGEQAMHKLESVKTVEFHSPAQRPLFSALGCEKFETTFKLTIPIWETALCLAMKRE